ncbi:MAG: twin-arginine translocation signal domain-containing protein [Desulfobulbaceae bacterium]|jgi:superoxide reductase|nr:twin-arginine translocation signal domain-containing protein [Desulfobulbaceae bacterium]
MQDRRDFLKTTATAASILAISSAPRTFGAKVAVVTKRTMSDQHFIVRHTLVLEKGTYVGATTFTPTDKPESSYALPNGYKGKFYTTSFCNQHDF